MLVSAPAKINLTLEITGIEDNGYHLLDTLFAWLELEDTVEFSPAESTNLTIVSEGVCAPEAGVSEDNLVLKALRAVEKLVGRELPTRIHLTKRIPTGGGLGGGSADAAATLIGLNTVHDLGLGRDQLLDLARRLGADVTFGLVGGLARGTNYGDQLEALEMPADLLDRSIVLVCPEFGCSTPEVYRAWDRAPTHEAQNGSQRFLAATNNRERLAAVVNDLESAAFALYPELRHLKETMVAAGLQGVALSGSGSSIFGFLDPGVLPDEIFDHLADQKVNFTLTKLKESTRFGLVS